MSIRRTIATVATRQFLKNLSQDSRPPEDVKATAQQLLKHFPTSPEVLTLAKRESYLQETVGISHTLFALGEGDEAAKLQALVESEEQAL